MSINVGNDTTCVVLVLFGSRVKDTMNICGNLRCGVGGMTILDQR
jgi:hypothetical protein